MSSPRSLKSPMPVEIVPFSATDEVQLAQAARVLYRAMEPITDAWPTLEAALGELIDLARRRETILLVALDIVGEVTGIIGGEPRYPGHVLEIHPLAVDPDHQRRGIGRKLLQGLEAAAIAAGYHTLLVGADDETGATPLGGKDLYPDPLAHLAALAAGGPGPDEAAPGPAPAPSPSLLRPASGPAAAPASGATDGPRAIPTPGSPGGTRAHPSPTATSTDGARAHPLPTASELRPPAEGTHQLAFYRRVGFALVGVIPDAHGFGKPDLWLAKRIRSRP